MKIIMHKKERLIGNVDNPRWVEITSALFPGESASDRPDLCDRVFYLKLKSLLDDLVKKSILGNVKAYTATVEFQKRGLPHCHILLIMEEVDKPRKPMKVNTVVSAEIPNRDKNPVLHEIIVKNMLHGPCGNVNRESPCMDGDGTARKCTKSFPKQFRSATFFPADNFPEYKRRSPENNGITAKIKIKGTDFEVDNAFVVPYNPFLSLRYNANINVEVVHSVQAVKYLYKYITKGQDRIVIGVQNEHNEVKNYLNARYISASEAFWRIYGFELHFKSPAVMKLPLHLQNEQTVTFDVNRQVSLSNIDVPKTQLTSYFENNLIDIEARNILYPDYPKYFTWDNKEKNGAGENEGLEMMKMKYVPNA